MVAVVKPENLNVEFDIGSLTTNKISIKIDGTLTKDAAGNVGLSAASLTIVSPDTGNILTADANGKAFLNQAGVQAVETVWSASEPSGFLTSTPSGTNGHTVTYGFDWTNAAFVEAVQDAVGSAIAAGAGITYDDVADSISSALGNIAFGDGLNYDTGAKIVTVKPDPASPSTVAVSAAGLSVTANVSTDAADGANLAKLGADSKIYVAGDDVAALATVPLEDAFGVQFANAFPV